MLVPPTNTEHWNYRKKRKFGREDNELSSDKSGVSVGHPDGDCPAGSWKYWPGAQGCDYLDRDLGVSIQRGRKKCEEARREDLEVGEGMQGQ